MVTGVGGDVQGVQAARTVGPLIALTETLGGLSPGGPVRRRWNFTSTQNIP